MRTELAMRPFVLGLFLTVAVLFPKTGSTQVYQFRTPPPEVTAAAADWQVNSEPVLVGGLVYYPTRGFRFFDGQVMAQIGLFDRVPVYADTTLEPYSVLYVPIGRDRMREYERRRDGDLAGTTGSRAPSFPVQSPSGQALRDRPVRGIGTAGTIEPSPLMDTVSAGVIPGPAPGSSAVGAAPAINPGATSSGGNSGSSDRERSRRPLLESIPGPGAANGVWLEFKGTRWYADGPAASFSPDRFEAVGEYRGFPVYRDKTTSKDAIWVATVKDGPLAPYSKR
jgi:hypothetical protein